MSLSNDPTIAVVIIGRNEGDRLLRCIASVPSSVTRVVYVDSGSTDDSVAAAGDAGATVVGLDTKQPFTAARGRNAGFAALSDGPSIDFVQFVDGDCEIQAGWIETARDFLINTPRAAVVCGRRRERFPDATVYNRLCDSEWDTPIGAALACGGDSMMRTSVLTEVGGFDPTLIAGEEPELCLRIRRLDWQVWRIDAEMTLHDAAMTRLGQWWKRARRAGHAAAEGAAMHGKAPEKHGVASTRRAILWGIVLPLVALVGAIFTPWSLGLLLTYPAQVVRLAKRGGFGRKEAWEQAFFMTLGKFPEALGAAEYLWRKLTAQKMTLIEYK